MHARHVVPSFWPAVAVSGLLSACTGAGGIPDLDPPAIDPLSTATVSDCHPSYAGGCVPMGLGNVDCAGEGTGPVYISGPLSVVGPDVFRLDLDGDGVACAPPGQ